MSDFVNDRDELPAPPNSADALLFDLGRVVLDIDFNKVAACWAGHAGCEPAQLVGRLSSPMILSSAMSSARSATPNFSKACAARSASRISDAQFLEGWNAIFTGEMPGIAAHAGAGRQTLPLYAFSNTNRRACRAFLAGLCRRARPFPRDLLVVQRSGCESRTPQAYDHVVKAIGVPASRIVFFDDFAANIEGARARGLTAVHVTSPDDVAKALAALGI